MYRYGDSIKQLSFETAHQMSMDRAVATKCHKPPTACHNRSLYAASGESSYQYTL